MNDENVNPITAIKKNSFTTFNLKATQARKLQVRKPVMISMRVVRSQKASKQHGV